MSKQAAITSGDIIAVAVLVLSAVYIIIANPSHSVTALIVLGAFAAVRFADKLTLLATEKGQK